MNNQPSNSITSPSDILNLRERMGLDRVEFGALVGVTHSGVGKWERGVSSPRAATLKRLNELARQNPDHDQETMTLAEYNARLADAPNPQAVTIDWQALVGEHQGIKGVSLRHLVSLGLYADYRRAAEALERDPELFALMSKSISLPSTGGRPSLDYVITDLRAVQMFCARARTEMGSRILEVILSHHNELQAMLAGDADAQARHEQAKQQQAPNPSDPLDVLAAMLDQMREQRDRQQALEREIETTRQTAQLTAELVTDATQRLADVEAVINTTPVAGHLSAYQIAQRGGYVSNKGRPHDSAVVALGLDMGLAEEGEAYQVMREINDHLCPSWRYTPNGAAMLSRELHRLANADDAPFFNIVAGTKTYTVYKTR